MIFIFLLYLSVSNFPAMIRYRLTLKIRNKCYLKIECVCRRDLLAAFSSWRSYYNGHGRRILSSAEKVQGESPGVEQEEDVETASAGRGRWRLLVPTWERGLERAGSRSWPIGPKRDLRPIQSNALAAHTGLRRPSGEEGGICKVVLQRQGRGSGLASSSSTRF